MISKKLFREALDKTIDKVLTSKQDQSIGDDEKFSDYGMDSLDQMNLLLELEDILGVTLGEIDLNEYDTPDKLREYVNLQIGN